MHYRLYLKKKTVVFPNWNTPDIFIRTLNLLLGAPVNEAWYISLYKHGAS